MMDWGDKMAEVSVRKRSKQDEECNVKTKNKDEGGQDKVNKCLLMNTEYFSALHCLHHTSVGKFCLNTMC